MLIYPAIDLFEKQAVRLYKGDYNQKTVYSNDPVSVAKDFKAAGASCIHLVDLEGAKEGTTPNFDIVKAIKKEVGLFCEIGGGIRNLETIKKYIDAKVDRVILGTAAVQNEDFVKDAVKLYGDKIAVGIDIKDGFVAIKGWTETSSLDVFTFTKKMQDIGVKTMICTDISKDGAMQGTNRELYKELSSKYSINIIASGGVSSIDDIKALKDMNLYGAIIGKAYYVGAINLKEAIEVAK